MKLRSITILFALAIASVAAHAQGGVYATFDAQDFTRTHLFANPPAGSNNADSPWLYGAGFGAYLTPSRIHIPKLGTLHTGPIKLGIDARGDFLRTESQYSRDDGIISIRVTPKGSMGGIRPYIQGGAGVGHTKYPGQVNFTNNWTYLIALGADHKIKGRVDWRLFDVGWGFMSNYASSPVAGGSNYLITVGTGIAFRASGK